MACSRCKKVRRIVRQKVAGPDSVVYGVRGWWHRLMEKMGLANGNW